MAWQTLRQVYITDRWWRHAQLVSRVLSWRSSAAAVAAGDGDCVQRFEQREVTPPTRLFKLARVVGCGVCALVEVRVVVLGVGDKVQGWCLLGGLRGAAVSKEAWSKTAAKRSRSGVTNAGRGGRVRFRAVGRVGRERYKYPCTLQEVHQLVLGMLDHGKATLQRRLDSQEQQTQEINLETSISKFNSLFFMVQMFSQ